MKKQCNRWSSHKWLVWGEPYPKSKHKICWYQARKCLRCGVIDTRYISNFVEQAEIPDTPKEKK